MGAIVAVVIVIVALGLAWHWFRQWEIRIEVRQENVRPYHPPMDRTITRRAAEILAARAEWGKEHPEKIPDHPKCDMTWCAKPAEVRAIFEEGELVFCLDHVPDVPVARLAPIDEEDAA